MTRSDTNTFKNGSFQSSAYTVTDYGWYDGAVQTQVAYTTQGATRYSSYSYTATGQFVVASVQDGRPRQVSVTLDAAGQALRRDEGIDTGNPYGTGNGTGTGLPAVNPHEMWYRFNGRQIGYVGNNGTTNTDYASSIAARTAPVPTGTPGAFRGGAAAGTPYADFDQNYDAINTFEQGSGGGSYTTRAGDTLSSIAAQLWGDASLWYKLAAANGLSGNAQLSTGTTLTIPGGVNKSSNTASTFRPYDPSDAYGDTSPTTPKPQAAAKKGCGVFGQILAAVVAVAVALVVNLIPVVGPFLAPYAANLASQGVLIATGDQDRINWKSVGQTALRSFLPHGVGIIDTAILETATQGIEVAVGLRSKLDFAGVAATALATGVANALDAVLPEAGTRLGQLARALAINTASGLVSAASRSAINGDSFGDSLKAQLPSIVAGTTAQFANALRRPLPGRQAPANMRNGAIAPGQQAPAAGGATAGTPQAGQGVGRVGIGSSSTEASGDDIVVQATWQHYRDARAIFAAGLYDVVHRVVLANNESIAQENYRIHDFVASGFQGYGQNEFTRSRATSVASYNKWADAQNAERDAAIAYNVAGVDRAGMAGLNVMMLPLMEVASTRIFGAIGTRLAPAFSTARQSLSRFLPAAESGGASFGSAASNNYRATFFAAHPELEGQVVVHHAVEQQVLTRYPGVVSEAEMHSLEKPSRYSEGSEF